MWNFLYFSGNVRRWSQQHESANTESVRQTERKLNDWTKKLKKVKMQEKRNEENEKMQNGKNETVKCRRWEKEEREIVDPSIADS